MPDATQIGAWICGVFASILAVTHPWAASGAAFGCCFFLAYPPAAITARQRWLLVVFSFGIGYAAGVFFYGEGPPWSNKAMLVSGGVSATGVSLFTAWRWMVDNRENLPPWMVSLLELIKLRKGSSGNGI